MATASGMPTHRKPAATVKIGGRRVSLLRAALIGQEADRRNVVPRAVQDVVIPKRAPRHVMLAGHRLTLKAAAKITAAADAQGVPPQEMIQVILEAHFASQQ